MSKKIKVGIDSESFNEWGGGIDFLVFLTEALSMDDSIETYLFIYDNSFFDRLYKMLKAILISILRKKSFINEYKNSLSNNTNLISAFETFCKNTKLIFLRKMHNHFIYNTGSKLNKAIKKYQIDVIFPSMTKNKKGVNVPVVVYVSDFQHKYLKDLFSDEEIRYRDEYFSKQISNSDYIIVNSVNAKEDINRFFPKCNAKIITLPFKPFHMSELNFSLDISKYDLPQKYYIISNQFWMHKDHMTAFQALEKLYQNGTKDMHIVCTGKLDDSRNPEYAKQLKKSIGELSCRKKIHLLGYVAKEDQLLIMKKSVGLIQPTLFEGGPGGGAVYNALCMGKTCIVSDIPINKEIIGYENVYYFKAGDYNDLSFMMKKHWDDVDLDDDVVKQRIHDNKKELGSYIVNELKQICSS